MSLVERATNILLRPAQEWEVAAQESGSVGSLITGYAIPLMILPIIGQILGLGVFGIGAEGFAALGMAKIGLGAAVVLGLIGFLIGLVMLFAMIFAVKTISPNFNGSADGLQAAKLMVYASTPTWLAGLVSPVLGILGSVLGLAAVAYVVYLIYAGVRPILQVPQEKVAGMTVVIVLIYIVLVVVLSMVVGGIIAAALIGSMGASGAAF